MTYRSIAKTTKWLLALSLSVSPVCSEESSANSPFCFFPPPSPTAPAVYLYRSSCSTFLLPSCRQPQENIATSLHTPLRGRKITLNGRGQKDRQSNHVIRLKKERERERRLEYHPSKFSTLLLLHLPQQPLCCVGTANSPKVGFLPQFNNHFNVWLNHCTYTVMTNHSANSTFRALETWQASIVWCYNRWNQMQMSDVMISCHYIYMHMFNVSGCSFPCMMSLKLLIVWYYNRWAHMQMSNVVMNVSTWAWMDFTLTRINMTCTVPTKLKPNRW